MKYLLIILIGGLFASCFNEGDCLVSATNIMYIQFKKKSNHTKDTAVAFAYRPSISLTGTINDSTIRVKPATTGLWLPVDINRDTTTFILHRIDPSDTIKPYDDILQVSYIRQSKVISRDCGAYTFFTNLKIQKTSLDSAQIKYFSKSLLKDPTSSAYAVNLQIFY
jgi:hypothetical protein